MSFSEKTDKMCSSSVYILIVLISLPSLTFANVEFVTKPLENVRTFPGQNVTLSCVLENLNTNHHIVTWDHGERYGLQNTISKNREVLITNLTNLAQHFSILGDEMNFTLLIRIPDENSIDFVTSTAITGSIITTYICSVIDTTGNKVVLTTTSNVIIQKWKFNKPTCGHTGNESVIDIGGTLILICATKIGSDPTIITILKSGNGQVLPITKLIGSYNIHHLAVTKEDHNAVFICESRRNGTNEIRHCLIGPITVNYKPEITITQTSPLEFLCTADARPLVNGTRWIVETSTPEDSFIISNDSLKITEPSKVDSEINITCEAENYIGKGTKTLNIPVSNSRDEEDGNDSVSVGRETKKSEIPISNNQDEEGKDSISVVIILVSVLSCVVAVFVIILLWFLRQKRNQRKHEMKSKNTVKFGGHGHHQVKTKNQDPKRLVYQNAAINVNKFHAEYQETENEIYVDGDRLSKDETNAGNKKLSHNKLEDLDQYRENENEIYKGPNMDRDYKECENEIYQSP